MRKSPLFSIRAAENIQNNCEVCHHYYNFIQASLVAQTVKRLPTVRETWVQSLGQEDLLEKEMATHSSIHAWKIP